MSPRARWWSVVVSALLSPLFAAGCEEETPVNKGPSTAADPSELARIEQGRKLLKRANDAMNERQYDVARKLLKQATELNNESQRFEIEQAQETLDKRQAKLWANEVDESFKANDCAGAFKQLAQPLKELADSEAFTRELRRLVGEPARKCVQERVDQKTNTAAYADARKIPDEPVVQAVLGPAVAKKLAAEIETTIEEALRAQVGPEVKARRWSAAVDKIEQAKKRGDATDEQAEGLLTAVRDAITPEISALVTRAIGVRGAAAGGALEQVDKLVRTVRWTIPAAGQVQAGGSLPEDLAAKRASLAIWVETQRLSLQPLARPDVRFTHGSLPVSPAGSADAAPAAELPHGTKVWIVGLARDKALVATAEPDGPLPRILGKIAGWVPAARLVREDTTDWLVPDEQLKGQRVWGPLRAPDPLWELGVVMDVSGRDITVQRLADGTNQKVTRQKLRSGRLSAGTRVITFCVAKDQPAQVVSVTPNGRSAKLKCDGGQEKEEDLASLRSKPEILPATR